MILTLLFKRKSFVAEDVITLYWLLIALGGVWLGANMGAISSSAYYAKGDTHTPTKLGIWTYTIYVPIKVMAFVSFGITGLAISTSAFFLINFVLQLFFLEKTLNEYQ